MSIKEWKKLSEDNRKLLISAVFNNSYIALTHSELNPEEDPIIREVLNSSIIDGDIAHINIKKSIRLK